jgi:calcineurin-like phosphoesterase family protein
MPPGPPPRIVTPRLLRWAAAATGVAFVALSCTRTGDGLQSATASRPLPPTSSPSVEPHDEPEIVVVAVGDIVCEPGSASFGGQDPSQCQHRETAALVGTADAILGLGDLQYENGSLPAFRAGYDRTWGRFARFTYPTPGNHEFHTPGAKGYFDYWASRGRPTGQRRTASYSFNLGTWHVISLDSTCGSGCAARDAFLRRDLARNPSGCTLAFWHHPYFNSGAVHGEEMLRNVRDLWDQLFAAGGDIVVNGHEHNYQRYAPQTPSGQASRKGIREFVVGTGGRSHYGLLDEKDPNYQTGDATRFGVLRLFLRADSYAWEFVAVGGAVIDRGGPTRCR